MTFMHTKREGWPSKAPSSGRYLHYFLLPSTVRDKSYSRLVSETGTQKKVKKGALPRAVESGNI